MSYAYLVTEKATGKQQLVEASSPSVAVSAVAGAAYETQRVEGPVLATLAKALGDPVKASKPREAAAEPAGEAEPTPDTQGKAAAKS